MRIAISGGRIGNPVTPEKPGKHGHPSGYLVRGGKSSPLAREDGGFRIPEGGFLADDVLVFARMHASMALRVTSVDEHIIELVSLAEATTDGPKVTQIAPGVHVVGDRVVAGPAPVAAPAPRPEPPVTAPPVSSASRAKAHVEAVKAAHDKGSPTGKES